MYLVETRSYWTGGAVTHHARCPKEKGNSGTVTHGKTTCRRVMLPRAEDAPCSNLPSPRHSSLPPRQERTSCSAFFLVNPSIGGCLESGPSLGCFPVTEGRACCSLEGQQVRTGRCRGSFCPDTGTPSPPPPPPFPLSFLGRGWEGAQTGSPEDHPNGAMISILRGRLEGAN